MYIYAANDKVLDWSQNNKHSYTITYKYVHVCNFNTCMLQLFPSHASWSLWTVHQHITYNIVHIFKGLW